jgi:hypothetical protein
MTKKLMNICSNSQHNGQNMGAASQYNLVAIQVNINVHQQEDPHTAPVCRVSEEMDEPLSPEKAMILHPSRRVE